MIEMLGARMLADKPHVYEATLPLPPSINRTYAFNAAQKRFYSNTVAKQWKQDAYDLLMAAGWQPLPVGPWSLTAQLGMYVVRRDIDSGVKITLDVACSRLEVDDVTIRRLEIDRYPVSRSKERLELVITAELGGA